MCGVQEYRLAIQPGDVIIAGTDGLLDNVFNDRSAKLVWDAKARGATPGVAAQQLAVLASTRALDPLYQSPFAKAAMQSGFFYRGGKVDDITVVISYVLTDEPPAPVPIGPLPPVTAAEGDGASGAAGGEVSSDSADSSATATGAAAVASSGDGAGTQGASSSESKASQSAAEKPSNGGQASP